jgi:hypothetical protein
MDEPAAAVRHMVGVILMDELRIKAIEAQLVNLRDALEAIISIGGNLPDEAHTGRTGPNDTHFRGVMYVTARAVARKALAAQV